MDEKNAAVQYARPHFSLSKKSPKGGFFGIMERR